MHANIKNSKVKLKVEPCEGYNEEELERIWHIKGSPPPSLTPITDTPPSQHMVVY